MNEKSLAQMKKHNRNDYEAKCPNCSKDDISEITGWCYIHHNPVFLENNRPFCKNLDDCIVMDLSIENAYFCNNCDTIYDNEKMTNWNWGNIWYGNCPVGRTKSKFIEETPKEYTDRLLSLFSEYDDSRLRRCLSDGFHIEAIVYLHIRISEQLRFLLIKKVKGANNITLNETNPRYNTIVPLLKEMKDKTLNDFAFIYERISEEERNKINELNALRNKFVHAWKEEERNAYELDNIRRIINKAREVERRLNNEVEKYKLS